MESDKVRKSDSLGTSAYTLRMEMKKAHGKYSDLITELSLLTKSELRPFFDELSNKGDIDGLTQKANEVFDKIESVLFDMEDTHAEMDELVQNVGGLEFANVNTIDKLAQIMRDQEYQKSRMTKELTILKEQLNKNDFEDLADELYDFQEEFSRFQDFVIDSVPRISKLFDELDKEEEIGIKYGKTNRI